MIHTQGHHFLTSIHAMVYFALSFECGPEGNVWWNRSANGLQVAERISLGLQNEKHKDKDKQRSHFWLSSFYKSCWCLTAHRKPYFGFKEIMKWKAAVESHGNKSTVAAVLASHKLLTQHSRKKGKYWLNFQRAGETSVVFWTSVLSVESQFQFCMKRNAYLVVSLLFMQDKNFHREIIC